jgi:hypothetical protein
MAAVAALKWSQVLNEVAEEAATLAEWKAKALSVPTKSLIKRLA